MHDLCVSVTVWFVSLHVFFPLFWMLNFGVLVIFII